MLVLPAFVSGCAGAGRPTHGEAPYRKRENHADPSGPYNESLTTEEIEAQQRNRAFRERVRRQRRRRRKFRRFRRFRRKRS